MKEAALFPRPRTHPNFISKAALIIREEWRTYNMDLARRLQKYIFGTLVVLFIFGNKSGLE